MTDARTNGDPESADRESADPDGSAPVDDGAWPHGSDGGPLPPRREQLPLPRRDGQAHLEPQLREPGGTGSGTPFDAFDPSAPGDDAATTSEATSASGGRAAAFRAATGRTPTVDGGSRHAAPDLPDAFARPDDGRADTDQPDSDQAERDQADGEPDASR